MEHTLSSVFNSYANTRASLYGRATVVNSPDQVALLTDLPNQFRNHLLKKSIADLYEVKGSIGQGNIARVPWVGVFKTTVTSSAENGFYIVLLFAEDMSRCYLSLNQGITAVEKLYSMTFALRKMREAADKAVAKLKLDPEVQTGRIELRATGDLGRAYEAAAIASYCYPREQLPSVEVFFRHFDHLIEIYQTLINRFGCDLYSLFHVDEADFQQVALEKAARAAKLSGEAQVLDAVGGVEIAVSTMLGTRGFVRSPSIAAEAIRAAKFKCEVDESHWTFTSNARKQRYVEAHHLIPISKQSHFLYSLDVSANVIALCATCHRLLHYGASSERSALLRTLLRRRKDRLRLKLIDVTPNEFLEFYGDTLALDD